MISPITKAIRNYILTQGAQHGNNYLKAKQPYTVSVEKTATINVSK